MRKLLLLPMLLFSANTFAGWEMFFCDSTDEAGNCTGKTLTVNFTEKQQIKVLLANDGGLRNGKIYFDISSLDPATYNEELLSTQEITCEPTAKFITVTVTFPKAGTYIIKARDSLKDYITSREIEVK